MSRKRWGALAVGLIAALSLSVSACSFDDSGSGTQSASAQRITLTVGDQVKQTQSLLEASGELKDLPLSLIHI